MAIDDLKKKEPPRLPADTVRRTAAAPAPRERGESLGRRAVAARATLSGDAGRNLDLAGCAAGHCLYRRLLRRVVGARPAPARTGSSAPSSCLSPGETFAGLPGLWFERALTRNTLVSLQRVVLGFGLATAVGIPLGVLCGCFRRISAFSRR